MSSKIYPYVFSVEYCSLCPTVIVEKVYAAIHFKVLRKKKKKRREEKEFCVYMYLFLIFLKIVCTDGLFSPTCAFSFLFVLSPFDLFSTIFIF